MLTWSQRPGAARSGGRFCAAANVIVTEQADATILLDLRRGRYYTLNPVSGLIWSVLANGASLDRILTVVKEEFDAPDEQLTADVEEFLGTLLAAQLIRKDS
jgi:hypothetical protein